MHHRQTVRTGLHAHRCACQSCNPPTPHRTPSRPLTPVEAIAGLASGFVATIVLDWLVGGPGVQIMWGG